MARTIKNLIDKDKNQLQLTTRRILSEILKPTWSKGKLAAEL